MSVASNPGPYLINLTAWLISLSLTLPPFVSNMMPEGVGKGLGRAVGAQTVGSSSLGWEPTPASQGNPAHLRHLSFSSDPDSPSPRRTAQALALQGSPSPAPLRAGKWQKKTTSSERTGLFLSFPPRRCFMPLPLSYQNRAQEPALSIPLTCAHARRWVAGSLSLGGPEL